MPGYKIYNHQQAHFVTCTIIKWVKVFSYPLYKEILINSLKFCQKHKGLRIHGWCIMPNHIHLMISAKKGYSLSSILRDFKKYTAHLILEDLQKNDFGQSSEMLNIFRETGQVNPNNKHFQLWIQNNRPMEVTSNKFYTQKMDYIHHNPVKAGLCANPKDYPYSSARWFLDKTGLIQIDEILI